MKVEEGLFGKRKGNQRKRGQERVIGSINMIDIINTLCVCMKMS
jgi:hypothetical protein